MAFMSPFEQTVAKYLAQGVEPYNANHGKQACTIAAALGRLRTKGYAKKIYGQHGISWEITEDGKKALEDRL